MARVSKRTRRAWRRGRSTAPGSPWSAASSTPSPSKMTRGISLGWRTPSLLSRGRSSAVQRTGGVCAGYGPVDTFTAGGRGGRFNPPVAYSKKFVLTPAQRTKYDNSRRMCSAPPDTIDNPKHMGVPIEISGGTPGVMVAADGTEVSLISTSEA